MCIRSTFLSSISVVDKVFSDEDGDWRQEAINGGSLKLVGLDTGSNGWASPPSDLFSLRGRNYFTKKQKCPSGPWLLHLAGIDWLRSTSKLDHALSRADNRVMHALRKSQCEGSNNAKKSFVLAVNLQIPSRDHHSVVFYGVDEFVDDHMRFPED
ncbi:hypothetical protein L2E82_49731 [Cichorium intybus]|uniref:Uncharacterized protein n=1 Tax=Cichorium intybus TaxID=13427 RepID=A0ACB8Z1E0_CICIN|nr:hypothetical protein L2E82_49731 [Cichorium intybus]